ncbi:PAS domain-containing protein [Altererythrobacter arenosus]|uniref:PAS domain-containing protein n=1 Tax=Altererythrobacter arenosus TaxID=3032592 RepID=A0ABY8FMB9_9SPHN|nr:GAF domain-containing protein [Altererythrobacter sp. CAU 1644]WFL76167.1 PAS domain-containing protein [Altererythrobacter sp. CAU 1644]
MEELILGGAPPGVAISGLSRLATKIAGGAAGAITYVQHGRQLFYAPNGFDLVEASLDDSFCIHGISENEALLVADARQDPRFSQNRFVTEKPFIRSYLGLPICEHDGAAVGMLCVMSPRPAAFDSGHIETLKPIVKAIEDLLELRCVEADLAQAENQIADERKNSSQLSAILSQTEEVAGIGVWQVKLDTQELVWSDKVYAIHGHPVGEPISVEQAIEYYVPEDRDRVAEAVNNAIMYREEFDFEATIRDGDGKLRRVRSKGERVDIDGTDDRLLGIFQEVGGP